MDRRKLLMALGAGAAWLTLAAGVNAQDAKVWQFYHHQSAPQFTTSVGDAKLAEAITKATDGKLNVRFHLSGTMQIAGPDMTSAVAQNVVQMADDLFYTGNVPIGAMLRLPFLLQSDGDFMKAKEVLQPYVDAAFKEKGVVVLAGYAYPLQYIWGREMIDSIDDLKGKKIRVSSEEQGAFIRAVGGTPVTMSAADVPSALDRGVVDGLVTGSVGGDLWGDLLDSGFLVGLSFNNAYYIVNQSAWDSLDAGMQEKVRAAVKEAADWNHDTMRSDDVKLLDEGLAKRMTLIKPDEATLKQAADLMRPYWDEWAKAKGGDAPKALAEIRQALGR